MSRRVLIPAVVAVLATVGALVAASGVRATVEVAPLVASEPSTVGVVDDPSLIGLSLLLLAVAGAAAVLAVARWRRGRRTSPVTNPSD